MTRHVIPFHGIDTIDAPDRSVCQYTGELADGLSFPALLPTAREVAELREANRWLDAMVTELAAERDKARQERDDAKAELDNMVDLTVEVGRLGNYLRHAIADRDEYRESADEWRDKYDGAQCRMDEMAAEIRELSQRLADAESARDTANVRASL